MAPEHMTGIPHRSKYNNKPVVVDGHRFPSRREASKYTELKLLERAGAISDLRLQVSYPIKINGIIVTRYIADFVYRDQGQEKVCDAKGFKTDIYRLKRKMMKAQYGVDILEL